MFGINKIKNKATYIMGFVFLQLITITQSFAQFAAPGANDLSVSFLSKIFGGLTGGGQDAFGASIGTFNGAILTVGGILAAYTILAGTLGTAHDGEMLGKKFSSVWVPIRYALGTALVLPVLSGGYCVMQAIVMWVITQGISLGNMAWTEYVSAPPLVASISGKGEKEILDMVVQTYLANVCVEANKKAISESNNVTGGILNLTQTANYGYSTSSSGTYHFGNQYTRSLRSNCGVITMPEPLAVTTSSAPVGGGSSSLTGISTIFKSVDTTPIRQAHIAQTQQVVTQTATLAQTAIQTPDNVNFSQLENIAKQYTIAMQSSAQAVLSSGTSGNNLATAASQQGWFLAGTWFTKIINLQNTVNAALGDVPAAKAMISSPVSSVANQANQLMANGHKVTSEYSKTSKELVENPDGKGASEAKSTTEVSTGGKVAEFATNAMTGLKLTELKNDNRHPIILMNAIGNAMMDFFLLTLAAAVAVIAGGGALAGALSLGTMSGAIAGTATIISTFLIAPIAILFTTGISLAYILPNLPLLIWMGIIIGWVIMVIEAVVAAPLWAVMHLHPNGDDLTGRGGNGYMLVLGLLLRPVLIVFGFISAIVLSGLFGEFVNKIFFETFASSQLGGTMGFFSIIAGTAVYAIIMYNVLTKTLNLMHIIPDQLMRWIGGGGEQLGQYAGSFSGEGMAKAGMAVGAVSGYMAKEGIQSGVETTGRMKQLNEAKAAKQAQQEGNRIAKSSADAQADMSYGGGYSAASNMISRNNDGHQAEKDKSEFTNASQSLGGKGSPESSGYIARVTTAMSGGASFSQAHQEAYPASYNEKFGEGAYTVASQLASSSGPSGSPAYAAEFNRATSSFNAKLSDYTTKGGLDTETAKHHLSTVFNNALQGHQAGETATYSRGDKEVSSTSLGAHLQQQSSAMNKDLGIVKTPTIKATDNPPEQSSGDIK